MATRRSHPNLGSGSSPTGASRRSSTTPGGVAPDPARLNELMPHPVCGWMSWVQILALTAGQFESLRPLLAESLELANAKWKRRKAA